MKTKAMVVRAKPHGENREQQFLGGCASIGWPDTGDLQGATRADIEAALRANHPHGPLALNASQIFNFVHLPVGSLVLTPSYETRDIHLFWTTGPYRYRREWVKEGNPHTVELKHIKTVSRDAFPDVLQRALKASKKAVTDFSKYEQQLMSVASAGEGGSKARQGSSTEPPEQQAIRTLQELLSSKNEQVRLQAAIALVNRTTA